MNKLTKKQKNKSTKDEHIHFTVDPKLKWKADTIASSLGPRVKISNICRDLLEGFCSQSRFKELLKIAKKVKHGK